ncbi:MAG: laccase domain-containing protein, partial [Candidatus Eisenbacteria bacterium]|nr:laccase domain-containing protein [Candidatus Eisenbacteria bacterium]
RLTALGIPPAAIACAGSCTAEEPERFFSHRRDGFPAGRMAAFLFRPDPGRPDHAPTTSRIAPS